MSVKPKNNLSQQLRILQSSDYHVVDFTTTGPPAPPVRSRTADITSTGSASICHNASRQTSGHTQASRSPSRTSVTVSSVLNVASKAATTSKGTKRKSDGRPVESPPRQQSYQDLDQHTNIADDQMFDLMDYDIQLDVTEPKLTSGVDEYSEAYGEVRTMERRPRRY